MNYYELRAISYILVIIAFLWSLLASARVKLIFNKYSRMRSFSNLTGAQAAERVLMYNGVSDVRIERISGSLTDHYDPRSNVIRLSDSVYGSCSPAAIGVACHEAGHAVQYARNYAPIKFRNAIIPITNIGSRLAWPLVIAGIILSSFGSFYIWVAYLGVIMFGFSVLFQLLTLPTEFNASNRAIKTIRDYDIVPSNEVGGVKKVLWAAAMTYVAALAVAITQLLRLLAIIGRRD